MMIISYIFNCLCFCFDMSFLCNVILFLFVLFDDFFLVKGVRTKYVENLKREKIICQDIA